MSRVTPLEHTAIGAGAGVLEVFIMQPTVAIKNALQEGRPVPKNPLHWYRGLLLNASSMAPITASQFGANRIVQQAITNYTNKPLTSLHTFTCAAFAGAVSAFVASPSELIIIQQQKNGRTLMKEANHFFSTYGVIPVYRGLTACMARETLYAAGYLGLCPILKEYLDKSPSMEAYPAGTTMLIAGLVGGIFAAAASHPADTIKTRMQAFMYSKPEYATLLKSAATIYKEGGVLRFWRGLSPRMFRIIAATFILNNVRTGMVGYLDEKRSSQPQLLPN